MRGRRLFQAFQQRVRGVHIERFGGMQHDHFGTAAMARYVDEVGQDADLVHCNAGFLLALLRVFSFDRAGSIWR